MSKPPPGPFGWFPALFGLVALAAAMTLFHFDKPYPGYGVLLFGLVMADRLAASAILKTFERYLDVRYGKANPELPPASDGDIDDYPSKAVSE